MWCRSDIFRRPDQGPKGRVEGPSPNDDGSCCGEEIPRLRRTTCGSARDDGKNGDMRMLWRPLLLALLAGLTAIAGGGPAMAQSAPAAIDTYTYVVARDEAGATIQGPVRSDAFPLWPVRACYTWVVMLAGPDRSVEVTELQKTPGPTRFDVTSDVKINETSDGTMWRRRVRTGGGVSGTWCVNDADPPGEYLYKVLIDGRTVADFRFCGIRLKDGEELRLDALSCKGRFLGS